MTVNLRIKGLGRLQARIDDMGKRARDLKPVFRGMIDKSVTTMFERQFRTRGAFGGSPWPPLKPSSAAAKIDAGFGGMPLLQRTRRMWKSFVASGSSESVRVIRKDSYERGSSVPYAAAHQTGGPRGLPRREIVPDPVPRHLLNTWAKAIGRYIAEGDA